MDVSYIRGCKRDPRADSKVNVAFKNAYLEKKLAILSARLVPKLTEVYVDERYCNVNHGRRSCLGTSDERLSISYRGVKYEVPKQHGEISRRELLLKLPVPVKGIGMLSPQNISAS
ncbi:hypothetical protein JG688_00017375 [Phytophthora aleatoria]|uniref:Uncharacterized protein n=1 Tax=Phytophthora aleatoria TaxID=2496075 RepID=A0A8J5IAL2_9STRA|nr:hypothetical protein JG688_00017375 [Phytophthora aleatoria]